MAQSPEGTQQGKEAARRGRDLIDQYERTGKADLLDAAVEELRRALTQVPEADAGRSPILSTLAGALYLRYQRAAQIADLDEAITLDRVALETASPTDPARYDYMANLADLLATRFHAISDLATLDEAIHLGQQAVSESPADNPRRSVYMSLLARVLFTRFQVTGNTSDLDAAADLGSQSLAESSPDGPDRRSRLSNLGVMMLARFRQGAQADDLERAIDLGRQALELSPPDDPLLSNTAFNLADALLTAARELGNDRLAASRISEALSLLDRFPASGPDGIRRASILRASGWRMQGRYDEAAQLLREVLAASPGDAEATAELAEVLRLAGRSEEAAAVDDGEAHSAASSSGTVTGVAGSPSPEGAGPAGQQAGQPQRPSGQLVPGYAADTVAGQDELGITTDVDSLCLLLASSQVEPPLSVGLFGDWGSGKSFFMQRMRERIDWIASESRTCRDQGGTSDFCENIRQITFNAWHYVDANLWASLITRIFDGLLGDTDDQLEPLTPQQRGDQERRRRRLLDSAELMAGEARRQRHIAEERLAGKVRERDARGSRLDKLNALRAADVAAVAKRNPTEVADALDTVPETLQANIELLGQVHGIWRQLARAWAKLGTAARWQTIGLLLVSLALVAVSAVLVGSGAVRAVPLIAAAGALLAAAARWLPEIKRIRQAADLAAQTVDQAVARQQKTLDAEIASATAEVKAAQAQLAAADAEIAQIQASHRIGDFVAARASSTDYRRSLGLISVIRRDLDRLSGLISKPATDLEQAIDRVILYIDDLDRCPAGRVAEVLQAVHLLLAFPLFIVVVGADARWLLRSLELHYAELITTDHEPDIAEDPELSLHWSATPQNYLDKIFQIPFSLRPMGRAGFDRLIHSTASPPDTTSPSAGLTDGKPANTELTSDQERGSPPANLDGPTAGSLLTPENAPQAGPAADSSVTDSLAKLPQAAAVTQGRVPSDIAATAFIGAGHRLTLLSTLSHSGTSVTILDARSGEQRGNWTADGACALSPDGSLVAALSDGEARLHEADSGRIVRVLPGQFSALHFSPDGNWLAAIQPSGLTAFDPVGRHQWNTDLTLPHDLSWLGVLPGESQAIQISSGIASTINLGTGDQQVSFEGGADVFACSLNGQVMATADSDALRIFDITTGQRRHMLPLAEISALAVSSDGKLIAAGFRERGTGPPVPVPPSSSIVVIEAAAGRPIWKAPTGDMSIDQLAFSATGHSLAAASNSPFNQVQIWSLAPTATNLTSQQLQLTEPELGFLLQLWPLVRTPRAAKRLINVYRLLRAPLHPNELTNLLGTADTPPEYPAALLLLTIVTGFPDLAQTVLGGLLQPLDATWPDFIGSNRPGPEQAHKDTSGLLWKIFFERYDQIDQAQLPKQIDSYVRWAPFVARYSFRTGRLPA